MADETDLEELARRYLDLWQDQMSALASDPEAAEAMTRMMTAAGANASAAWAVWPAFMAGGAPAPPAGRDGEVKVKDSDGAAPERARQSSETATGQFTPSGPAPAGAAAAAAASEHGGLDLDGLASRLAELEERVRALESSPRRGSGGASRKPRGSRS